MTDIATKLDLLRKRVQKFDLDPSVMLQATSIVERNGMIAKMAETLRKEWLNDLIANSNSESYRLALSGPGAHFLKWVDARSRDKYRVSPRAFATATDKIGPTVAAKLRIVVWPQEIAWAQRMRLDENPYSATKAALFLREAEANPSKTFLNLVDVYSEAVKKLGYLDSAVQEMSADEIRFARDLPEFAPLFQRYAARAYADALQNPPREKIVKLAQRAAIDETTERRIIAARQIAQNTERFPMRRSMSLVRTAIHHKLTPNQMFLLENAFLVEVEAGREEIEPGMRTADTAFMMAIGDAERRQALLDMAIAPASSDKDGLDILNFTKDFFTLLPASFKPLAPNTATLLKWQTEIVEGRREFPYDVVSDFGFFMLGA
jgi:hypothetical protein